MPQKSLASLSVLRDEPICYWLVVVSLLDLLAITNLDNYKPYPLWAHAANKNILLEQIKSVADVTED